MRVPFLQATIIPVALGGVTAWQITNVFRWDLFLLTLLGASLIQIATNMFNDYFDFKSGNDIQVKHQNPFAGGGRILTAGLVTPSRHLLVSTTCLVLGCLTGLYLISAYGLPMLLVLGLVGVVSSYFYVGPPFGLLIAAVLWINEFPDIDADRAVGKKTLVLRLGQLRSIGVFAGLLGGSYLLIFLYAALRVFASLQTTSYVTLIALFSLPIALKAIKLLRANYLDPHSLIPANARTIMLHLSFGTLTILGIVIGAIIGQ